ncbi:MAG: vitamin K epoxide reductase family protein [Sediminibacterium sp.]|nr:vitamin K epoxide reductase family protein [Sediminibacterium sp.]MDP3129019.1 vitamin K epoxide reductase family protein [Sediminibacterium sp.]
MFNQYEPNVKAVIVFLKLLGVKVTNTTVDETLQNHPDYPGLLSISDSLHRWNVPNAALKVNLSQIDELESPFIAYVNNELQPVSIVTSVGKTTISYLSKNYERVIVESREAFLNKCTGIYLVAEKGKDAGEKDFKQNRRKSFFKTGVPVLFLLLVLFLSFISLNTNVARSNGNVMSHSIAINFQFLILIFGAIISSFLIWYEIDSNNPLLKKVCTSISKGNCSAILNSKQSKLFSWLGWSEMGFFYFTGGLLLLIFSGQRLNENIFIVSWFNILAAPYTVFSVYYQWRVVKQWCVLCLGVQLMLLLGLFNALTNDFEKLHFDFAFDILYNSVLIYLLPVLFWFLIKPYILHLQEAKNTKKSFLRLKFNKEIFEALLKKQNPIEASTNGLGIDIGNLEATNTLIKVCNPYCSPCSKSHAKIEQLLETNTNIKVKIIFKTPTELESLSYKATAHLLTIAKDNPKQIRHALDDWYMSEKKNYDDYTLKYPISGELTDQNNKVSDMQKWCDTMNIRGTPTIFFNGFQLPEAYRIEDLTYFLLE